MRRRSLLIAAALGLGLVAAPAAASATSTATSTATNTATSTATRLPAVIRVADANRFPEGVAWDPTRHALLVGSFGTPGRISAVDGAGVATTIVSDPDVPGFTGMKVDAARHRIVAVYGNPAQPGPSGLAYYDLASGRRLHSVSFAPGSANDVALAPDGTAYVTDSGLGAVYRVDPAGHASTLVRDDRLLPSIGANGIVWHPGGYLEVVNYTTGKLYRVDLRHPGLTEVPTEPLIGGDGMALRPDGTLLVMTNRLNNLPGSSPALHELRLSAGGRIAVPVRDTAWPDPAPTTIAITPDGDYVLDGRIDKMVAGEPADDFVLRRI